jgi:hypothetical protein
MNNQNNICDETNFDPSPSRLAESLRDTGYSYEAAFADIVDNSIAANASCVEIDIYQMVDGALKVTISDNGDGMDLSTLLNAMRYGSPRRKSPKSLGKFGMGLKTASTSFCRKLTVISRKLDDVNVRTWDIDEIINKDQWILITPDLNDYEEDVETLDALALNGTRAGTIVIWENIDRLISQSGNAYSRKALEKLINEIENHLSGIFGKFLDTENCTCDNVVIKINGQPLVGWDPTGKWLNTEQDPKRVTLVSKQLKVVQETNGENIEKSFELNGYILPNKSEMTDSEIEKIRYGNDNQGFYIYRENRLIYSGGWPHRIFTKDPHLNLVRIELNFEHDLDDYFQVDIRKTRIIFPQALRDEVKNHIAPLRNEANRRYRSGRGNAKNKPGTNIDHENSGNAIKKQLDNNVHATVTIIDPSVGTVSIENKFGEIEIKRANLVDGTDVSVQVEETLDDGTLWTYGIDEDGNSCVIFNSSHIFYQKFYQNNKNNTILMQSMDSVFWALANAEISTISTKARRNIEELRFLVSKDLRNLSDELPDVE